MDKWKKNSSRTKVCKIKTTIIAGELPQCTARYKYRPDSLKWLPKDEKYMWFAPHSGFSNQVSEFKNALLIAGILNRTLIIPPIMDHHAVALGSCPKFRVKPAHELRSAVWDHINSLMKKSRYVSMADIIDLSGLISSSLVKVIDLRIFVSLWCGLDIRSSCSGSLCHSLAETIQAWGSYKKCGELLSGLIRNTPHCVYGVEEDCRTTVWTYQEEFDNTMDSFQPDDSLRMKKKINYSRKRRNIDKALGHGSKADHATVLLFGTLFTAPYKGSELYIDIHKGPKDERIGSLLEKTEFLLFAPEILNAGKEYARERIKEPFLCAQLRMLDGQFKNHWQTTFSALKDKLKNVQNQFQGKHKAVDIFLMTDLPESNWTGTYLGDLAADSRSYKLHVLNEKDDFVVNTSRKFITREYGFRSGVSQHFLKRLSTNGKYSPRVLPDILLYIEETICSCASVGFVGTVGSTIADNIEQMRKHNVCSLSLG
ncbi:hypothetical protein SUGI_0267730 [Cryptomeria japonica]|nr:hypothetical protein SUGI_0267730 [Cryptomeria japonica]